MKQRRHKAQPERLTSIAAMEQYRNHSPKPLQRLRHALNHFSLVKLGVRQPDVATAKTRARSHLAGYRKMMAVATLVSSY